MSAKNLDGIFKPRSIALVGASETQGKLGNILLRNLIEGGYKGPVYPVNPKHKTINGQKSFKSVMHIDGAVDLAVIVTPIESVPMVMQDCARKQILGS